jgi:hypothetical protein
MQQEALKDDRRVSEHAKAAKRRYMHDVVAPAEAPGKTGYLGQAANIRSHMRVWNKN